MTNKSLSQVETIFHAAQACKPSDRALFLDRECGEDSWLRAEVESLLSAAENSESFLEVSAKELALSVIGKIDREEIIGKILNSYEVIDRLGEGGMGEVYLCEDTRLGRRVALKFLPACLAADERQRAEPS
jgi:serine/threonine protein kinase